MRVETMAIFCSALCSKNELAFSIFPEVKRFVSADRHQLSLAGVQVHNSCYCQCNSSPIDVSKLVPDKKMRLNLMIWTAYKCHRKEKTVTKLELKLSMMPFLFIEFTSSHILTNSHLYTLKLTLILNFTSSRM